jgi:hypothetical protein
LSVALPVLRNAMKDSARFSFLETSAENPLLMLSRRLVAGRFGVPKYGSRDERPLSRGDLTLIQRILGPTRVIRPDFVFFELAAHYLGRRSRRSDLWQRTARRVDEFFGRFKPIRRFTYWIVVVGVASS